MKPYVHFSDNVVKNALLVEVLVIMFAGLVFETQRPTEGAQLQLGQIGDVVSLLLVAVTLVTAALCVWLICTEQASDKRDLASVRRYAARDVRGARVVVCVWVHARLFESGCSQWVTDHGCGGVCAKCCCLRRSLPPPRTGSDAK